MIDNNLLTRIFENILEKGEITGIERDRISFKYKDKSHLGYILKLSLNKEERPFSRVF